MIELEVDLCISGETLNPALVSQALGISPDDQQLKGDKVIDRAGRRFADRKIGLWSISSQIAESAPLNEHVRALLSRIGGAANQLKEFKAAGFDVYLFVGAYISKGNGEFTLDGALMRSLSDAGIEVDFDVYSND